MGLLLRRLQGPQEGSRPLSPPSLPRLSLRSSLTPPPTDAQIINSLAKGRPADAALLAAGIRPPRPETEEPLHPDAAPLINTASIGGGGDGTLLQAHKAAFFFKLERELEKVRLSPGG